MNVFDDADSDTGRAPLPTADALAAATREALGELRANTTRRVVEIKAILRKSGRMPDQKYDAIARTLEWYRALDAIVQEAQARVVAASRAHEAERRRAFECCFVSVAKEHLDRETFQRLCTLAEMRSKDA